VGFYPGGHGALRTRPIYETIKKNSRPFQRYLEERAIAESYWELAGAEDGRVTKWPLPKTARRWLKLDGFTVGEHFRPADRVVTRRAFLDVAQEIFLDLYPLWLFASSNQLKTDLELYRENAKLLARPLTKAAAK
jgi:hypothetical protein